MVKNKTSNRNSTPKINESILRVGFLEQAAQLLATKSRFNFFNFLTSFHISKLIFLLLGKSKNDGISLLSKNYMNELKEVRFVQQILLDKTIQRNFCRKCKRIWITNNSGDNGMMIKITKKHLFRYCTDCGASTKFVRNENYKSRNEKLESK